MSKPNVLTGKRFGRWTVLRRAENNQKGNTMWLCRCECGKEAIVAGYSLTGGRSKSCGCLHNDILSEENRKKKRIHGETHTRLYNIWRGMRSRCNNGKNAHYKDYGGRGISVCEEWENDYEAFRDWALENGYEEQLTIDRINNDMGYTPENCRWTTMSVQNTNRRRYHWKRRLKEND